MTCSLKSLLSWSLSRDAGRDFSSIWPRTERSSTLSRSASAERSALRVRRSCSSLAWACFSPSRRSTRISKVVYSALVTQPPSVASASAAAPAAVARRPRATTGWLDLVACGFIMVSRG